MTESDIEEACLEMLEELGYKILHGPDMSEMPNISEHAQKASLSDISEGGINEERKYNEVILTQRLRVALERINKNIPKEAIEEAIKIIKRTESHDLVVNNQHFHRMITNGVPVQYRKGDRIIDDHVWLFDFKNIKNNSKRIS